MAKHGTRYGYQEGCRCTECVTVNSEYIQRRRAGLIPKRPPPAPPVVKVFSDVRAAGQKIEIGEKRTRKVSEVGQTPCVGAVPVALIGAKVGDFVEVEYLADCVIIRRVPTPA